MAKHKRSAVLCVHKVLSSTPPCFIKHVAKYAQNVENMQEELDALQHKYRLPESLAPLTDGLPVNIHSYQR